MNIQTAAHVFPTDDGLVELIRVAIERLRPWMANYVRTSMDFTVSENDFTERILERLSSQRTLSASLDLQQPETMDLAVKQSLKSLVQEDKRSAYRRRTVLLDETLPDPNSSRFSEEVETAASARAILDRVPEDLLPVIRSLYGLSGEEPMTARQVASTLGIQEEALRQRLFRLRSKLRRELRENT